MLSTITHAAPTRSVRNQRHAPRRPLARRSAAERLLWIAALGALLSAPGCGRKNAEKPAPQRDQPAAVRVQVGADNKAAAPAAKAAPAQPAKPAAVAKAPPKAPSKAPAAAAELAAAATPARNDSVALFFADKGSDSFALPTQNKPAIVRATAINAKGRPIEGLGSVAGGRLMLIAARTDLSWMQAFAPEKLNGSDGASHTFDITFPQAGPHVLMFIFQPPGAPRVMMPSYVNVQGERKPDHPSAGIQQTWKGARGLRAKLLMPPLLDVCAPAGIATRWTTRGKRAKLDPLALLPLSDAADEAKQATQPKKAASAAKKGAAAAHVSYLVLGAGLRDVTFLPSPTATDLKTTLKGLPKQTAAVFRPTAKGSVTLLAVARVGGRSQVARFDVVVGGELPSGGCPK